MAISRENRVNRGRPCRHCGKPDWCLVLDSGLEVCARGLIADGWEGTGKTTAEGHEYLCPKPEPKARKPIGQVFFHEYQTIDGRMFRLRREYTETGKTIGWVKPLGDIRESDLLPYRWQEVQKSIDESQPIFFVEGEKCADDLWTIGIPATTIRGKTLSAENVERFKGATAILAPDRDLPGVEFARKLYLALKDVCTLKLALIPPSTYWWHHLPGSDGLDVSDFLTMGGSREEILGAISEDLPFLLPEQKNETQGDLTLEKTLKLLEEIFELEDEAKRIWELGLLSQKTKRSQSSLINIWQAHEEGRSYFDPMELHAFLNRPELERKWLISGYVPIGTVIGLIASGGTGKSLLAYDLVKAIASGKAWNGFPTQKCKVLIVQTDEQEIDTRERMEIAGFAEEVEEGQVFLLDHWQFSQFKRLAKYVDEKEIQFCVIDSFTSSNRRSLAEEKDTAYAQCIYDLRDLASRTLCTFLVLHHTNKAGGSRGTTAFEDNVSEVWFLTRENGLSPYHRVLEIKKSRSGSTGKYKLLLDVDDYSWKHEGDYDDGDEVTGKPLTARILDYLLGHPGVFFEPEELCYHFPDCKSRDAMRKNLDRLRKRGLIQSEERVKEAGQGKTRYKVYCVQRLDVQRQDTLTQKQSQALDIPKTPNNHVQRPESSPRQHLEALDICNSLMDVQRDRSIFPGDRVRYVGRGENGFFTLKGIRSDVLTVVVIKDDLAEVSGPKWVTTQNIPLKDLQKVREVA